VAAAAGRAVTLSMRGCSSALGVTYRQAAHRDGSMFAGMSIHDAACSPKTAAGSSDGRSSSPWCRFMGPALDAASLGTRVAYLTIVRERSRRPRWHSCALALIGGLKRQGAEIRFHRNSGYAATAAVGSKQSST
jgi:hypothetical protein